MALTPGQQDEQDLRDLGYHDDDISAYRAQTTQDLQSIGYTEPQIKDYYGIKDPDMSDMRSWVKENLKTHFQSQDGFNAPGGPGTQTPPKAANDFYTSLDAGLQQTVTGLGLRGKMPDTVMPEHYSTAMGIANTIGSLGGEIPTIAAGMIAGGETGLAIGTAVGAPAGPIGMAIGGGVGTILGAAAGGFAVPAAMRKMLVDHYEKGDISTASDFAQRAMGATWEGIKGAATGVATAVAGPLGKTVAGPVAGFGAELAAMTHVSAALEGHLPDYSHFADSAIVLTAFHGVSVTTSKLMNIYANTGEHPYSVVEAVQKDPVLAQQIVSANPDLPLQAAKEPPQTTSVDQARLGGESVPGATVDAKVQTPEPPPTPAKDEIPRSDAEKAVLATIVPHPEQQAESVKPADFMKALVDDLDPIKRINRLITSGEELPAGQNAYSLGRTFRNWAGRALSAFKEGMGTVDWKTGDKNGESFEDVINSVPDGDLKGLKGFMLAASKVERPDIETPFSLEDAQKTVADGQQRFGDAAQRMTAWRNRAVLKVAVDSGLISPDRALTYLNNNEAYASFAREMDIDPLTGKAGDSTGGMFKPRKGSERNILDPIHSNIKAVMAVTKQAELNRVMLAQTELGENQYMKKLSSEPGQGMGKVGDLGGGKIGVMRNGVQEVWQMHKDLYDGLKAVDFSVPETNIVTKIALAPIKASATAFRLGTFVFSPGFIIRHGERVAITGAIQSEVWHRPFAGTIQALGDITGQSEAWQKMLRHGGVADSMNMVREFLDSKPWEMDKDNSLVSRAWNVAGSPYHALVHSMMIGDTVPRMAEFNRLIANGATAEEAALASRNVTADITKSGSLVRKANPYVPVMNIGVQGMVNAVTAIKNNPIKTTAMASALITAPSVMTFLHGKGDPRYDEAPFYEKMLFWIWPTNKWEAPHDMADVMYRPEYLRRQMPDGSWQVNNGITHRFVKPFELGILFGSVPEQLLSRFVEENPHAMDGVMRTALHGFVPAFMPPAVNALWEQATNKQAMTGNPLIPDSMKNLVPSEQYLSYTSETAKQISKVIGWVGGSPTNGVVSPIVVDNWIHDLAGQGGQYAIQIMDAALHKAGVGVEAKGERPETSINDIPFIKEFLSRNPGNRQQPIQDFYNRFQQATDAIASYKKEYKANNFDAAQRLKLANPTMFLDRLSGVKEALSNSIKLINMTQADPKMSGSDKRQIIQTLYYKMWSTAEAGLKTMNEIEKRTAELKPKSPNFQLVQ